jgi:hypothetical protein
LDLGSFRRREDLFLLSGASRPDPGVESWLNGEPVQLRAIARSWFSRIRHCGTDVFELIQDGCPVACVEDAAFAYVNAFKGHVNVGFFYGAWLEDAAGLLEGSGKRMRHVKVRPGAPLDEAALQSLIDTAYADIKARLGRYSRSPFRDE